jgi:lysophospholipase L1-like esterase
MDLTSFQEGRMRRTLLLLLFVSVPVAPAVAEGPSARWEPAIQAFEKQDAENPPPEHGVLFVGSSSIRLWDLKKSFPDKRYINRGFGGSQIADSIAFVDRLVLKHEPRVVIMYAGDNDIAAGKTPQVVASDFATFQKKVHAKLPKTRIMYVAIKPSLKRWNLYPQMAQANQRIAELCASDGRLTYLDIATPMLDEDGKPKPDLFRDDGLHLNKKGYAVWSAVVAKHLNDASGKK